MISVFQSMILILGGLAYFTVPSHTEECHALMYWYLGLGMAMLALLTGLLIARWRGRTNATTRIQLMGPLILGLAGYVGGLIVSHHSARVDPKILAPEIRNGHSQPTDIHPPYTHSSH